MCFEPSLNKLYSICGFTIGSRATWKQHLTADTSASQWHTWWCDRLPAGCRVQRTPQEHWLQRADPQSQVFTFIYVCMSRQRSSKVLSGPEELKIKMIKLNFLVLNFNKNFLILISLHFDCVLFVLYRNPSAKTYTSLESVNILILFLKEVSYDLKGCIYLIKNIVKTVILWNIITI